MTSLFPHFLPLRELDRWLRATFDEAGPIHVCGARLRSSTIFDILELRDITANTVRLKLPRNAPSDRKFSTPGKDWAGLWAPALVAAGVISPVVDPLRLHDLLHEKRRIRLCCDTNALAGGVLSWLQIVLDGCADVVTSAVVDRELAAWPDRKHTGGRDFWSARTIDHWARRTQYRLARRFVEAPPARVVVERLSPEQGALVLAKFRDEGDSKSPDADVLLVELARSLVRDQPRNARVIFLTGDRNNARTATGALGPENVLFAAADDSRTRAVIRDNAIAARGWWSPDVGLGSVSQPSVSHLLWSLLAVCDVLVLRSSLACFRLELKSAVPTGSPSDWADPWLAITSEVTSAAGAEGAVPEAQTSTFRGGTSVIGDPATKEEDALPSLALRPEPSVTEFPVVDVDNWLLPPQELRTSAQGAAASWRPNPTIFFAELLRLLGRIEDMPAVDERYKEVRRILAALGASDATGGPGTRLELYRQAWDAADHDWFHAEFLSLPGYRQTVDELEELGSPKERQRDQIAMARALGQVARLARGEPWKRGDRPVRSAELIAALGRWLPQPGSTLSCAEIAQRAAAELKLTPFRFERAMIALWQSEPQVPFEARTGGSVEEGYAEQVIVMGGKTVAFTPVDPQQLRFGRATSVRFITRVR
jgi:hypothetical protein